MTTYSLARLLVVPGFPGDSGWPVDLAGGAAGTIVMGGSTAVAAGDYLTGLPGDPRPFVSVDYEGGKVVRQSDVLGPLPSARELAATMSPDQVRELAAEKGRAMRSVGINVDYAPVADLDLGSPIIDSRSFSSDPAVVVSYAGAFSDGLRSAGVLPVLKHFPGHGSANGDSHKGAVTTDPWSVLRTRDVPVFAQLLQRPGPWMVMMGHMTVPGLSSDDVTPTSLDPAAYQALRAETGFNGPVITDDLSIMRAITDRYPVPEAVVLAIQAGADLALIAQSDDYEAAVNSLAQWGDVDAGHRERLEQSARRAFAYMPCGRSDGPFN